MGSVILDAIGVFLLAVAMLVRANGGGECKRVALKFCVLAILGTCIAVLFLFCE